jgi:predicted TIM-barrel fold metal-dependent hydrolase
MHLNRRQFLHVAGTASAFAAAGCHSTPKKTSTKPPPEAKPAPLPLVIDTHQHLWDLDRQKLPWLGDAPAVLRKSFRTEDYLAATAGLNVRAVYMEVDVAEATLGNEAEWVLKVASEGQTPTRAAVIGGRPDAPDFAAYIKKYVSHRLCRGVRRVLHSSATPAGDCRRPEFVRGVRLLGAADRSFDLCMRAPELMDAAKLAELCPDTRFVLDHCGNPDLKCFRPLRSGEDKPRHTADDWKRAIDALAKRPNVIGKISGIAASLTHGPRADDLAPAVNHCLDAFGPDRVVFGGDWPVCLLGATYRDWVVMLTQITASRPEAQQRKLWSENALKFYRLKA